MRTIGRKHQRVLAAVLMGLLSMPCGLKAQNANKQVWWLKTDKGQYIDMSRVKKLANVNSKNAFEVIVHQGQGASGVMEVTFEKNNPVSVKGDANGDGFIDKDDVKEVVNDIINFQYTEKSDVNKDGKVNVVDMVELVNIIHTPVAGARGLLSPFGPLSSVSVDVPGTIIPQDDSGATGSEDVPGTIPQDDSGATGSEDVPGTIPQDDSGATGSEDVPEPRDPQPGTIDPQDPEPGTIDPQDDPEEPRDPQPDPVDPQDDPEEPRDPQPDPIDPQDDPEEPRDPQPEIWPIEPLPGTITPPVRPLPNNPVVVVPEPITIEPEPERIIPQTEPVADLGSVPYFRVQFTENLLEVKKYAADGFTFFNPAYDYLDFKYSLPFTDSNLSGAPAPEYFYYIGTAPDPKERTRFGVAKTDGSLAIKKITAYNLPVKFITVSTDGLSREVDGKRTITYTFNALPRNMEELMTLEVNNREYFSSPHFVTALFICCLNRMPDNSSDAWNMINYLRTHTATVGENNILKVSNVVMQNVVQNLLDNDKNGYPVSNGLRSYFAGSSPDNKYTPTTPYQVTVVERSDAYTTEDGYRCAQLYVESSGDDNLVGPLKLRKVDDHGWLVYFGEEGFTKKMKIQE